ncbi:sulfotransferase family protein [Amaricoccus solimangrovi]|nr:sulfotransferase [Amaricoccus solimangrovi]
MTRMEAGTGAEARLSAGAEPVRVTRSGPAPILVTGAPRSGSTWVGNVLALDPRSAYIHEPFNKDCPDGRCRARFSGAFTYVTRENEEPYLAPLADTLAWKYSPAAELRRLREPVSRRRPLSRDLARLVRDYSYFETMRRRGQRVILKDPLAIFSADWIAERFDARVVVVIRHPAAFIASLRAAGWQRVRFGIFSGQPRLMEDRLAPYRAAVAAAEAEMPDGVSAGALLWNLVHHHIALLREEHPDWIFVRHEDLSRAPESGFREIFTRLGLDFSEDVRSGLARFTSGGAALSKRSIFGTARRTMRNSRDSIALFRERLTPEELARIRDETGPLWQKFYSDADW